MSAKATVITLPKINLNLYKSVVMPYKVKYRLIESDIPADKLLFKHTTNNEVSKIVKNEKGVCFSALNRASDYLSKEKCNRLMYHFNIHLDYYKHKDIIDIKTAKRWISLAKRVGMLPKYLKVRYGRKEYITSNETRTIEAYAVLDLTDICKNTLYMYLSTIRYPSEYPLFIRAILELVENKLNPYAAFIIASHYCVDRDVHHIIRCHRRYGDNPSTPTKFYNTKINIYDLVGLMMFCADKEKYDNVRLDGGRFSCNSMIENIGSSNIKLENIRIKHLFIPNFVKILSDVSLTLDEKTDICTKLIETTKFEFPDDNSKNNKVKGAQV